ncbi:predicted protein [Lichtheimia corymbifera JMRC:FSU:9682]|uniref:Uncharacterized protein n=1 Tax=Lichtheimia corymbifera JMRC:FSU:9682 TaxID=1263082 RepID=A0A068RVL1_9FUNG|nr:predicted protein [Lichtheimia corymbifera JMRC:FSU:9682]
MSNDNTNDQPLRDLEAEAPGVSLSQLLMDTESRGNHYLWTTLDDVDDDGVMDQQESDANDDCGENAAQVQGHVQEYLLRMQSKWLVMSRNMMSYYNTRTSPLDASLVLRGKLDSSSMLYLPRIFIWVPQILVNTSIATDVVMLR